MRRRRRRCHIDFKSDRKERKNLLSVVETRSLFLFSFSLSFQRTRTRGK